MISVYNLAQQREFFLGLWRNAFYFEASTLHNPTFILKISGCEQMTEKMGRELLTDIAQLSDGSRIGFVELSKLFLSSNTHIHFNLTQPIHAASLGSLSPWSRQKNGTMNRT